MCLKTGYGCWICLTHDDQQTVKLLSSIHVIQTKSILFQIKLNVKLNVNVKLNYNRFLFALTSLSILKNFQFVLLNCLLSLKWTSYIVQCREMCRAASICIADALFHRLGNCIQHSSEWAQVVCIIVRRLQQTLASRGVLKRRPLFIQVNLCTHCTHS